MLGLTDGPRLPFTSRGYWHYAGQNAIVHLTEFTGKESSCRDTPFNHYALACRGLPEVLERLMTMAIAFEIASVPSSTPTQVFLRDPAGVGLELSFEAESAVE